MKCPYCNKEMEQGIISGDGRYGVYWKTGNKKANIIDKLIGKARVIEAVDYTYIRNTFIIKANYCDTCKKILIDTEILL